MAKSDIVLHSDGIPFRYVVLVEPVELEKQKCPECEGCGEVGSGWLNDDVETCPRCRGQRTVRTLYFTDTELEAHLKVCMDEYLRQKFEIKLVEAWNNDNDA